MVVRSQVARVLIERGIIDRDTLERALIIQAEEEENPRRLEEILTTDLGIDYDTVFSVVADLYAFPKVELEPDSLDEKEIKRIKQIINKIPEDFKRELIFHKVLPFKIVSRKPLTLLVLAANPIDKIVEKIPKLTEFKKYEVAYCPLDFLEPLIERIAPLKNEFLKQIEEAQSHQIGEIQTEEKGIDEYELDNEINKSLLVNLYEGTLIEAVRKQASDVHIIPHTRSSVDIYFRIDGKLHRWHRQEHTTPEAMAAVVKDRTSGMDRFERDTAQDGFSQRLIDDRVIRYRVSVMPIIATDYERKFESIVIRVLDDRNVIRDLDKLGLQEKAKNDFLKAISQSKGIVLLTGPTGSGKSTTLMAALYHLIDPSKNVLTCEDPVEYVVKGARQIKISHKLDFEEAVRRIVRHDPDIVMVGEIRDKVTADVAIKLANTGHLTLATLHTNDAPSAISRLYKMGVEPFLLAYAINIIVAQRLVRELCPYCKKPLAKEKYKKAIELGIPEQYIEEGKIFEAGKGCSKCMDGYKGRIAICQSLYFTPEIRKAIVESGKDIDEEKIRAIGKAQGMMSLLESGIERICEGITSIEEVIYAASEE